MKTISFKETSSYNKTYKLRSFPMVNLIEFFCNVLNLRLEESLMIILNQLLNFADGMLQAIENDCVLISNNIKYFQKIQNLELEKKLLEIKT